MVGQLATGLSLPLYILLLGTSLGARWTTVRRYPCTCQWMDIVCKCANVCDNLLVLCEFVQNVSLLGVGKYDYYYLVNKREKGVRNSSTVQFKSTKGWLDAKYVYQSHFYATEFAIFSVWQV